MNPLLLGPLLEFGKGIIDRLFPDPAQKAAAQLELLKMQQSGDLALLASQTDLAKAQIGVNAEEAKNASLFVSGWRPSIGWVCSAGLAYEFLLSPLLPWVLNAALGKNLPPMPDLPSETLMTLLMGMLGLGGLRTIEKVKGAA